MREYPWHERVASAKHYFWHSNIIERYSLTTLWLQELKLQQDKAPLLVEALVDTATDSFFNLDTLLDDTTPDDLLARLEETVAASQNATIITLLKTTPTAEHKELLGRLEFLSEQAGKECALKRWPQLPKETSNKLREILNAFQDSPFAWRNNKSRLLVTRATDNELCLEFLSCPHNTASPEAADILCSLETNWIRGFVTALNPHITLTANTAKKCRQRWSFESSLR
jgi:hypothetical protein